ncbi:SAM-dependent methyltransferase [Sphingobacterium sp. UT-1RO-CII-1]|uniref:SAM-dependent methyltransferase n=1 Tax=Sphingobacterium sp. UT-1RO-CII-1 TaxID=2995225 RepID=UPI00227B74B0|nr:SAM-dependent methyltransferase [Sphingobacterium sp. UT-1RO-CII-1]MCY4778731.1 SAM-dependent methyltransferase [Sphingobacterium sp. UT-1RO-CII-1]
MSFGTLYLIPVPLSTDVEKKSYTAFHLELLGEIKEYVVENEKISRKFLKDANIGIVQNDLIFHDYGKHKRESIDYNSLFKSIFNGQDIGLMSDAGCPGVADPGMDLVEEAHKRNIKVVPLVGPSSILLALMASGFSGQKFTFHGYLPIDKSTRVKKIKELEIQSLKEDQTQIFIETPFRNNQLLDQLLQSCKPQTKICVACNLTGKDEYISSKTVLEWKKEKVDLHKKPTIFLLYVK